MGGKKDLDGYIIHDPGAKFNQPKTISGGLGEGLFGETPFASTEANIQRTGSSCFRHRKLG